MKMYTIEHTIPKHAELNHNVPMEIPTWKMCIHSVLAESHFANRHFFDLQAENCLLKGWKTFLVKQNLVKQNLLIFGIQSINNIKYEKYVPCLKHLSKTNSCF